MPVVVCVVSLLAVSAAAQPPVARPVDPPGTKPAQPVVKPADPAGTTSPAGPKPAPKPAAIPPGPAAPAGATTTRPAGQTAATPAAPGAASPALLPETDAPYIPTADELGLPIYPQAKFIASYDAGLGQRFYLFGSTAAFADVVNFYKLQLKQKGELIFDTPATHSFEVGRFKETDVSFAPGVTVKDYTWSGSEGFLNPKPGATPARYPTVIQLVSAPSGVPIRRQP